MKIKEEKYLDYNIIEFDAINGSSMDLIREYQDNTIIIVGKQTDGRGQDGKKWFSGDQDVLLTIKISNQNNQFSKNLLIFLINVSVRESIEFYNNGNENISCFSKLHNDILLNGKKVSGILIEEYQNSLIIGIGVNVNSYPNNEYIKKMSAFNLTSLKENNIFVKRDDLIKKIIDTFYSLLIEFKKSGFEPIKKKFLDKCYQLNKEIEANHIKGIFRDIENDGTLVITLENGVIHHIKPSEKINYRN